MTEFIETASWQEYENNISTGNPGILPPKQLPPPQNIIPNVILFDRGVRRNGSPGTLSPDRFTFNITPEYPNQRFAWGMVKNLLRELGRPIDTNIPNVLPDAPPEATAYLKYDNQGNLVTPTNVPTPSGNNPDHVPATGNGGGGFNWAWLAGAGLLGFLGYRLLKRRR